MTDSPYVRQMVTGAFQEVGPLGPPGAGFAHSVCRNSSSWGT